MRLYIFSILLICFINITVDAQDKTKAPWEIGSYYPAWEKLKPQKAQRHEYQKGASAESNGEKLKNAVIKLKAGDRLVVDPGKYEINDFFDICVVGTAKSPIWLEANPAGKVILTRKNKEQNVINIGQSSPCKYFYLGGFEIVGGSTLLKLGECENVWIDKNIIHDGSDVGIAANSKNTSFIYITNNEVYDPGKNDPKSSSEGMYLGANEGKVTMQNSVIAMNHVYNCRGVQGDGIELKQGSFNNWMVKNYIHDCNYPCITVYGTGNNFRNQIEGNLVLRSNDNAIQIQGDANVLNNICISAKGAAFSSHDHQGKTGNIAVYNNTFVNSGMAVKLGGWDNRKDLKFYNNVILSEKDIAVELKNKTGVALSSNYVFGKMNNGIDQLALPNGIMELNKTSWDGKDFDVRLRNAAIGSTVGAQLSKNCAEKLILKTK
jgi:hypothetical protein